MTGSRFSRRHFLQGCGATVAASAAGPLMMFSRQASAGGTQDVLVHVFLRGGFDGLNFVVPIDGNDRVIYERDLRANLAIAATGTYGALPLTNIATGTATGFGLHPSATGLRDLWNAGKFAIVQSCGLQTTITRSHFDAQLFLDLGTPGLHGTPSGWLTRAWESQPDASGLELMPELAVASRTPTNLLGATDALAMATPGDFALNRGVYNWQKRQSDTWPAGFKGVNETMASMWQGPTGIEDSGAFADRSLRVIAQQPYAARPAAWPNSNFSSQLWTIAQSIRFDLGLRYATLDLGGWDTHEGQGTAGSGYHYYQNKLVELSAALSAFYAELATSGDIGRVTVIVQSEFGRRAHSNASGGTDHGYGNPLLVLGGAVNGGRMYGDWRGLASNVLSPYFGDIPVTTDFRRVYSELMIRRMKNNSLGTVFPGYTGYSPLGIVQGADMAPNYAAATTTAALPRARLPDHPQPAYGSSLDAPDAATEVQIDPGRLKGRGERMLIRRGH